MAQRGVGGTRRRAERGRRKRTGGKLSRGAAVGGTAGTKLERRATAKGGKECSRCKNAAERNRKAEGSKASNRKENQGQGRGADTEGKQKKAARKNPCQARDTGKAVGGHRTPGKSTTTQRRSKGEL